MPELKPEPTLENLLLDFSAFISGNIEYSGNRSKLEILKEISKHAKIPVSEANLSDMAFEAAKANKDSLAVFEKYFSKKQLNSICTKLAEEAGKYGDSNLFQHFYNKLSGKKAIRDDQLSDYAFSAGENGSYDDWLYFKNLIKSTTTKKSVRKDENLVKFAESAAANKDHYKWNSCVSFLKEMRNVKLRQGLVRDFVLRAARNENHIHLEQTYNLFNLSNKNDREDLAFLLADIIGSRGFGSGFEKLYNTIKDPKKKLIIDSRLMTYAGKSEDHGDCVMFLRLAGKEHLKYEWFCQ